MTKLLRWIVVLAAVLAVGCGVDAGEPSNGGTAGAGGSGGAGAGGAPDCPEDPADGPVPSACGIWVSASMGFDDNKGSRAAPVRTLTRAIELAAEGPRRVYACNETWFDELLVPGHVSLHGGFDCQNDWTFTGTEGKRAMVTPLSPIGMTWVAGESADSTFITDFYVEANNTDEPGGSSIGVFIRDDVPLVIRRCEIVAGNGADGVDGEPGDSDGNSAEWGSNGEAGADACSAPVSKGGAAVEHVCATGTSKGGAGGDGGLMVASDGAAGEPNEPPYSKPGLGEQSAPACTDGTFGYSGTNGESGIGGQIAAGQITAAGYVPHGGEDGKPGKIGAGGGGGGATFGSAAVCGAASPGGAGGGSGGSGGCGGKPGRGGQGGGSSFGVMVHVSDAVIGQVSVEHTHLVTANGGNGGNGGAPQFGGSGGKGGTGGMAAGSIKPGCKGGNGGSGGRGGYGGGGAGGHTVCVAYLRESNAKNAPQSYEVSCELGKVGVGGVGNPAGGPGGGAPGVYSDRLFFTPPDAGGN